MTLSGFVITAGGVNKESISLIYHFKNFHGSKNIQEGWKKKKKKKKQNNLDRAKQQIPNENRGFWGGPRLSSRL